MFPQPLWITDDSIDYQGKDQNQYAMLQKYNPFNDF